MGMPISSYQVLKELTSDYEPHVKGLDKFSLFGFILHDKEQHDEFHGMLDRDFHVLDDVTGNRFLFFSLLRPPEKWLANKSRGSEYPLSVSILKSMSNAPVAVDQAIAVSALAKQLEIKLDLLPCIVVTRDLNSKEYHIIKTDKDLLHKQLNTLTYISRDLPSRETGAERSFYSDVRNLDGYEQTIWNHAGLAQSICTILDVVVANSDGEDSYTTSKGQENANKTKNNLMQALIRAKEALKEKRNELSGRKITSLFEEMFCITSKIDDLALKIAYFHALSLKGDIGLRLRLLYENPAFYGLESESKILLRTGYRIAGLVRRDEQYFDLSPIVLCLAKPFENEMNLSLVQWIRRKLGIEMPDYFNTCKPGVEAYYRRRHVNINFNYINGDGVWVPPSLGQSQLACRYLSNDILNNTTFEGYERSSWDRQINFWKEVKSIRNAAAHPGMGKVEHADLSKLVEIWDAFFTSKFLERTCRLKQELRG